MSSGTLPETAGTSPGRRSRSPTVALIAIGLATSLYLLVRTLALMDGSGAIDACSAVFGASCDESLSSAWFVRGLPLAGWGVTYYGTLASLLGLGWGLGDGYEREATVGGLLLSVAGAAGSALLAVTMLGGWAPVCPLCVVVHGTNLLLPIAIWRCGRLSLSATTRAVVDGVRYVFGAKVDAPTQAAWKAIGFATSLLVGLALYQWTLVEITARQGHAAVDPARLYAEFDTATVADIPLDPDVPRRGSVDARARLVVFSSFECPGCRALAAMLQRVDSRFGDRIAVEFRHFPFGECNPHAPSEMQPRSCAAARCAAAAAKQGRFWEFHDALFAEDAALDEQGLLAVARRAGLDLERLQADRVSSAARARVRADTNLAAQIGVAETPAVFLNGRRLRELSEASLELLIRYSLE